MRCALATSCGRLTQLAWDTPNRRGAERRCRRCAAAPQRQESAADLGDVLDSLRSAFGVTPAVQQPAAGRSERGQAAADRATRGEAPAATQPTAAAGRGRRAAGSSSSTSSGAASLPARAQQGRRRSPFSDLIAELEHEQRNPSPPAVSKPAAPCQPAVTAAAAASPAQQPAQRAVRRIRQAPPPGQGAQQPGAAQQQQERQQQLQPSRSQTKQQLEAQLPWLSAAAQAAGGKHFKPVWKGDLALPGGPAWSALRRHVAAAGSLPGLPCLDAIVLVEGDKDQQAVARAVNAPVYVCDGTRVLKPHVRPELDMLAALGRPLLVLTDPDERGRELRLHLEELLGPLGHAFVPEPDAAAAVDGPVHAAGNRGIEHVVPGGVQQALARARPSFPRERAVWSTQSLQQLRLANAFDAGQGAAQGPDGAAARRRQLCALLGLGRCTAAQLLLVLNRFFSEEDVAAALARLG